MRNRGAAIIIESGKVALNKRVRGGQTYYVFPGGGIELWETPEQAAVREVFEELGITVKLREQPLVSERKDGSQEFYFFADIVSGSFGSGKGEEFEPDRGRGTYTPVWVHIGEMKLIDVRPREIAAKIIED